VGLLTDRDRLQAMRDAGRKTAQNRFCASLVVPQYVRYHEQVLGQQGPKQGSEIKEQGSVLAGR